MPNVQWDSNNETFDDTLEHWDGSSPRYAINLDIELTERAIITRVSPLRTISSFAKHLTALSSGGANHRAIDVWSTIQNTWVNNEEEWEDA